MNRDLELHGLVGGKPNIKKVLKGSVSTSTIGTKKTITVNLNESVNKDKSIILIQNPRKHLTLAQSVMSNYFVGDFISNNSVTFTRTSSEDLSPTSQSPQFVPLQYTVIEFDNVKSLQKGIIVAGSTSGDEAHKLLSAGVNTRKSLLFYNKFDSRDTFTQFEPFVHINLRGDAPYSFVDFYTNYYCSAQYWVVEFF